MSDSSINVLIVAVAVGIGLAVNFPRFMRIRRRSIGRILRRELTREGATYSVNLRKGEGVWRPGKNGRIYGPARGTYTRDDRPEGVLYHLELVSRDGSVAHFTGPLPPSQVEGSEARARYRKVRKWVPLIALVPLVIRFGCIAFGILFANVASDRWSAPIWVQFLIAIAAYVVLERVLFRGLDAALKIAVKRRSTIE